MALRKPLVIGSGGEIQQLQSGDTLNAADAGVQILSQTNDESSPIVIGTPVYNDAADGVKKAKADASGTSQPIGLVFDSSITNGVAGQICTHGVLSATTTQWDAVAGTSGGLTVGTKYYLSAATAGQLTATAPSTVSQYIVEMGIAISTTELRLSIKSRILL